MTKESITEQDGSYSEIYYLDEKGQSSEKAVATRCIIREYDSKGSLMNEIHGICNLGANASNDYEQKYEEALENLRMWYEQAYDNEKALRTALWTNYENANLDPDGKAIRFVEEVPCSADALLSMYRICMMEDNVENIIPTFERYRKVPIFFFPRENGGINQTRAKVFGDKIDFALLDIKRYYMHKQCQMQDAFERTKTKTWLNSMQSFENIVDWYGIKGFFVDEEYRVINIETGEVFDEAADNFPDKYWSKTYYENIKKYSDMWAKRWK